MFIEPSRESQIRRRFPRVFLASAEESLTPLSGILLALPDRTHVPILAISTAGILIPTMGILGQLRLGQILECKLKFAQNLEPVVLRLRILRLTAQAASLALDSLLFEDRLKIDQVLKDQLIFSNLKFQSMKTAPAQWRSVNNVGPVQWWNGPFDTNFLYWNEEVKGQLSARYIIEYDGIILTQDQVSDVVVGSILKKSVPTIDESKGYAGPWFDSESQKISMGTSWRARLLRLMSASSHSQDLDMLIQSLTHL